MDPYRYTKDFKDYIFEKAPSTPDTRQCWDIFRFKNGAYHKVYRVCGLCGSAFDVYTLYMKDVLEVAEFGLDYSDENYDENKEFIWEIIIFEFETLNRALERSAIIKNEFDFKRFMVLAALHAIENYWSKKLRD